MVAVWVNLESMQVLDILTFAVVVSLLLCSVVFEFGVVEMGIRCCLLSLCVLLLSLCFQAFFLQHVCCFFDA